MVTNLSHTVAYLNELDNQFVIKTAMFTIILIYDGQTGKVESIAARNIHYTITI